MQPLCVTKHKSLHSSELCSLGRNLFIQVLELNQLLLVAPSESIGLGNELCHLAALLSLSLVCQLVHISGQTFRHFLDGSSTLFKLLQKFLCGPSFLALCIGFILASLILKMDSVPGPDCCGRGKEFRCEGDLGNPPCSDT